LGYLACGEDAMDFEAAVDATRVNER